MKPSSTLQFCLAAALIVLTAVLLQARSEIIPKPTPLSEFPSRLANWDSSRIELDQDTLEVLGAGDFMERSYRDPNRQLPYIDLFLAYFASQRAGDTIHSPQNCLPGSGWAPIENTRVMLSTQGHAPFPANRYIISKAGERELVLYWFWAHNRGVASEYWAKYYLVRDSILIDRSDGALVRLVTPMLPGETAEEAQQRLSPFTAAIVPLLDSYIPR